MFKILTSIEIRYWLTKLKIAEMMWIVQKIRHIMKAFKWSTIVFTNYVATIDLTRQTILSFSFIDKLNLRLVRVSQYFSQFRIEIHHKLKRLHVVSNVLSRLITTKKVVSKDVDTLEELDVYNVDAQINTTNEILRHAVKEKINEASQFIENGVVFFHMFLIQMSDKFRERSCDLYH